MAKADPIMAPEEMQRFLRTCFEKPIAFHRIFAKIAKGASGGLFLSQAWYWSQRTTHDEWFYKTQEQWQEETALNRSEQERARKVLKAAGILEEKRVGVPAKLWYKINKGMLHTSMQNPAYWIAEFSNLECRIQQSTTENTSEITPEKENLDKNLSYPGVENGNVFPPGQHTLFAENFAPPLSKKKTPKPLAEDDWLRALLLDYDQLNFLALNDDNWWVDVSQPLETVFEQPWLNGEFGKISAYLRENPKKKPASTQGWKRFIRTWLHRSFEQQRRMIHGHTQKSQTRRY